MSNIVLKMKNEIIERSNKFQNETKGTKDEYNLYLEHIKYVYKYALLIAKNKNVDMEVVKLSALLHDISMTDINLDRSKHNIYSAELAEKLLKENNYLEDKIDLVKKCILNHSSKRKEFRTTEEEKILVNADAMAHFDCIASIYSLGNKVMELNEEDSIQFVKDKLTKDYNEIDDDVKEIVKDKYIKIMSLKNYKQLESLTNYVYLKVPNTDELHYRQKWMNDPNTMNYNAGYDIKLKGYNKETGTITKTNEEMIEWYNNWINKEPDRYFAYIYDSNIDEPIGEIYYYLDGITHSMGIIIQDKYRGKGYSYKALIELEKIAFKKNQISELSDIIPLNRTSAIKAFKKAAFVHTDLEKEDIVFGKKIISKQLLITREMYNKNIVIK